MKRVEQPVLPVWNHSRIGPSGRGWIWSTKKDTGLSFALFCSHCGPAGRECRSGRGSEETDLVTWTTAVSFWSAFENYLPSHGFLFLHFISFFAQIQLIPSLTF